MANVSFPRVGSIVPVASRLLPTWPRASSTMANTRSATATSGGPSRWAPRPCPSMTAGPSKPGHLRPVPLHQPQGEDRGGGLERLAEAGDGRSRGGDLCLPWRGGESPARAVGERISTAGCGQVFSGKTAGAVPGNRRTGVPRARRAARRRWWYRSDGGMPGGGTASSCSATAAAWRWPAPGAPVR